tara:strand:- start:468 stop:665 length:198 start_codon:yes stop_codon:yes gene_type:complete
MKLSTQNKKGIIKRKPLMDLLNEKVELRKQLILLKKLHESQERQEELLEKIQEIEDFIAEHKIQK